ncbi:DUF3307 domain-containing protein [Oscillochloris sp. ZM17-4]|uniref:DUF3307 domain-containing protein n=1 Tax=Oscillochloris sp. ZM17-4 TaxID=2866714 RepID=UPI001C7321E1|nr:DUF3307 domain-containing protein [Oscillochloris sp. ZM17-4]MBX0329170.1 DUF3307 domain-containing protein [Oscillochloris sp. ZM17-4]
MFYLFLLAHLVADFMLQPLWLVRRKRGWDGLLMHVGVVLLCMLALIPLEPAARGLWPAMLVIGAVHLAADRWKVRYADRIVRPPFVAFVLDQAIHAATIALVLGAFLPAAQLWSPQASPLALPAIYAACYLLATFAVPIGLIVALDPTFQHASLAAAARLRSLVAAALVLSLSLFAGPLALPATLAGVVAATRRPASRHPLDSTAGTLAVITVASDARRAAPRRRGFSRPPWPPLHEDSSHPMRSAGVGALRAPTKGWFCCGAAWSRRSKAGRSPLDNA